MSVLFARILLRLMVFHCLCIGCVSDSSFDVVYMFVHCLRYVYSSFGVFTCLCAVCVSSPSFEVVKMFVYRLRFYMFFSCCFNICVLFVFLLILNVVRFLYFFF